ncbi:hypothetical protein [Flaviaesturariibacter amylovorans]|uniref:Outer membrane protein beta-barrel domain-containing protein n=1 Tax=Flaviaesturariibacter amylovorans TaxID=1084520 RepID=A0ABP8GGS9_9BACT
MKRQLLILLLSGATLGAGAQGARSGPRFRSINSAGLTVGSYDTPIQFQTVNGLQWDGWYAGIGIAYDPYRIRTVPYFLDLRRRVGPAKLPFFLYADAGSQLVLAGTNKDGANHRWNGKLYFDAGVGYTVALKGRNAIELALGYSRKAVGATVTEPTFCPGGNCPDNVYRLDHTLRRVMIRAGWSF